MNTSGPEPRTRAGVSCRPAGEATVWQELGVALCLVLVIEGIIPFLYPRRWRQMVMRLAGVSDRDMRIAGFMSMVVGTGLLYLIN